MIVQNELNVNGGLSKKNNRTVPNKYCTERICDKIKNDHCTIVRYQRVLSSEIGF